MSETMGPDLNQRVSAAVRRRPIRVTVKEALMMLLLTWSGRQRLPRSNSAPSSSSGVSTCGRWPVRGSSVNVATGIAAA